MLYVKESHKPETMQRYGHGTPDDWIERNVYTPLQQVGHPAASRPSTSLLFGVVPGAIIYGVQMAWIPFWAAGVINGIGHYWGYRNFQTDDDSTNIVPWRRWIGGEELHNNHHAYPDFGQVLDALVRVRPRLALHPRLSSPSGLANVRKRAPKVKLDPSQVRGRRRRRCRR